MAKSSKIQSPEMDVATDAENQNSSGETNDSERHEQIAELAYRYWEEGGKQDGTAELDWIQAEKEYEG